MRLTEKDTPLALAAIYDEAYPYMDKLRREACGDVPPECYIPIAAGVETIRYLYDVPTIQAITGGAELTALYIWRKSKVIYYFDGDLTDALAAQAIEIKDTDVLPVDLLLHPPHPCVYIKSGYFQTYGLDGFFSWIEWDLERKEFEQRWQFVTSDMGYSVGFTMHLSRPTIGECMAETAKETERWQWAANELIKPTLHEVKSLPDGAAPLLMVALEMILYLVSENRDEAEDSDQRAVNRRAKAKSKNWRQQSGPESVRLNNVGVRVGAALRKARREPGESAGGGSGTGRKVQTHLRRGHWHHYWVGPMDAPEKRKLILKWTAPTIINPPRDGEAEAGPVIYPVI